jgi:hypothetical protein
LNTAITPLSADGTDEEGDGFVTAEEEDEDEAVAAERTRTGITERDYGHAGLATGRDSIPVPMIKMDEPPDTNTAPCPASPAAGPGSTIQNSESPTSPTPSSGSGGIRGLMGRIRL